jgi:diguanylate cyclase (GGDEF)-like protein
MDHFTWLCPTASDRERFLDMHRRLYTARIATIVIGATVAAAAGASSDLGWWVIPWVGAMIALVVVGAHNLERRRRPELWVYVTTVLNIQLFLTLASLAIGGPRSDFPDLLAVPVLMVASRFSKRGIMFGAPVSAALVLITTLGADPSYVTHHPDSVLVPLSLVIAAGLYMSPLVDADVRHRADSTLDQLTGLLNRRALEPRFLEIAEQAALTGRPVSVVMADIDHFKHVNDEFGHAAGDEVLRAVSVAMRRWLRSFELLYRTGGEEFLLLLPDADAREAAVTAERLRSAVAAMTETELTVTCSFGVAAARGEAVDLATLTGQADAALYRAKHEGRNRVVVFTAGPETPPGPAGGSGPYAGDLTPSASAAAARPVRTAPSM